MTGPTQLASTPRELFLQAAKFELENFVRKESEFRKKEREERASALPVPARELLN